MNQIKYANLLRNTTRGPSTPNSGGDDESGGYDLTDAALFHDDEMSSGMYPHTGPESTTLFESLPRVRAVADYESDDVTELSVNTGDVIFVVQERDSGWWLGAQLNEPNRRGWFPCTYVEWIPG